MHFLCQDTDSFLQLGASSSRILLRSYPGSQRIGIARAVGSGLRIPCENATNTGRSPLILHTCGPKSERIWGGALAQPPELPETIPQ